MTTGRPGEIRLLNLGQRAVFIDSTERAVLRVDDLNVLEGGRRISFTVTHRFKTAVIETERIDLGIIHGYRPVELAGHWPHLFTTISMSAVDFGVALNCIAYALLRGQGPELPVDISYDDAARVALRQMDPADLPAAIPGRAENS